MHNSLKELKKEAKAYAAAFEELHQDWRLGSSKLAGEIIATTSSIDPDSPLPVTLRHFLHTRIATDKTPARISQAMASLGIEPHLARLQKFKDLLFTLGISDTDMYEFVANNMELSLPASCRTCSDKTLADRWLHDNHGRYNRLVKDVIEEHNYRSRLRNALQRDGKRTTIVEPSRRAELSSFLYMNRDQNWYLPTAA